MNATNSTLQTQHYAKTSLDPLPNVVRRGMIAMGTVGLLSTASTLSLLLFITYRMVYWRRYYDQPMIKNQILVLIYNLLLADFQQSLAFIISFYWASQNRMVGPHPACSAQGWFIQIGDVSSGLFVLSIGIHTFISIVWRKIISTRAFMAWVIGMWISCITISSTGLLKVREGFVPTAAWCWIGAIHRWERLYLHYVYIFLAQIGSIIIYTFIIFFLHGQVYSHFRHLPSTTQASEGEVPDNKKKHDTFAISRQRILQTTRYMALYPITYVSLTLPLAATRICAMAGRRPPVEVYIFAGLMMTSCGWVDVLLYVTTRKVLISSKVTAKPGRSPWRRLYS